MALEGNDWLYLGGAALGGAALGALGANLFPKSSRSWGLPYAPFLRRKYKHAEGSGDITEAQIGAVYDTDASGREPGYLVRLVGDNLYGEEGITSDFLVMRFHTPEEAMDAADGFMTGEDMYATPVSKWELVDEVKKRVAQKEPAGIWIDAADLELEGKRKRGKKKSGWY